MEVTNTTCICSAMGYTYPCARCLRAAFHRGYQRIDPPEGKPADFREGMLHAIWRSGDTLSMTEGADADWEETAYRMVARTIPGAL